MTGQACFARTPASTAHQTFVQAEVRRLYFDKSGGRRGVLVWHGTGTGKTCTAALVMSAMAGSRKGQAITYVSTASALEAAQPLAKIARCALERGETEVVLAIERGHARAVSFEALADFAVQTESGGRQWSELGNLVVDEAHHLLEPRFLQLRRVLLAAPRDLKVVAMTATPGATPAETLELLDMMRPTGSPLFSQEKKDGFSKKELKALSARLHRDRMVVFYDAASDTEHFAEVRVDTAWTNKDRLVEAIVSSTKVSSTKVSSTKASSTTAGRNERHLVWVPDPAHSRAVAADLTVAGVKFVELTSSTNNDNPRDIPRDIPRIVREFNSGASAPVMLITDRRLGEAVDLRGVRHVHVIDAELDAAGLQQVVGRAWRYCSHALLPAQDWTIDVHVYDTTHDLGVSSAHNDINVRLERLDGVASRARDAVLVLSAIQSEIAARLGIDSAVVNEDTVMKFANPANPVLKQTKQTRQMKQMRQVLTMWKDLQTLRAEVDQMGELLVEGDLRTLTSVRDADRVISSRVVNHGVSDVRDQDQEEFYVMLRGASLK